MPTVTTRTVAVQRTSARAGGRTGAYMRVGRDRVDADDALVKVKVHESAVQQERHHLPHRARVS
jgi:hypothetical protein